MKCSAVRLGNVTAIVCARERRPRPRRCRCGAWAKFLCDHAKPTGGTCDEPICREHALEVGEDKHLCRRHQEVPRQGSLAL